jgi:hypothetical protein
MHHRQRFSGPDQATRRIHSSAINPDRAKRNILHVQKICILLHQKAYALHRRANQSRSSLTS